VATPGNRGGLYQNLFFFVAGLHFRPLIERLAGTASWRRVALDGTAFAMALLGMAATASQQWPLVWPLVSIIAVSFGVTAAGRVSRWRNLGGALAALGRRTLPVYVIHMPVLALLDWLLFGPMCTANVRWQWVLAVVEPALLTAAVTTICLALHAALRSAGLIWFFDLPGSGNRRAEPARNAVSGPRLARPAEPALDGPTRPLPLVPQPVATQPARVKTVGRGSP